MEVTQVADAKPGHLEDEYGIVVLDGHAAAKPVPDVGGHVPDQHFAEVDVMVGRSAVLPPASQHVGNVGMRKGGPVALMRDVHRHHVGNESHVSDESGVVGDGIEAAMGLKQIHGMIDVPEPHGELVLDRRVPGDPVDIGQFGGQLGNREAMARATFLGRCRNGRHDQPENDQDGAHEAVLPSATLARIARFTNRTLRVFPLMHAKSSEHGRSRT